MRMLFGFFEFLVFLTALSQVIYPIITLIVPGMKEVEFFWIFKKDKSNPTSSVGSLDELEKEVDTSVEQFKTTKQKVEEADEKLKSLKNKTK